jgi:hypothetical protein
VKTDGAMCVHKISSSARPMLMAYAITKYQKNLVLQPQIFLLNVDGEGSAGAMTDGVMSVCQLLGHSGSGIARVYSAARRRATLLKLTPTSRHQSRDVVAIKTSRSNITALS